MGFIGLIAPHIARRVVGLKHQFALPISGFIGAILVICADLIAKTIVLPAELPVGIIVALIGVPYFIFLLLKSKV
ncbi:iron chelate uptake ABC transporter family permease subunit [Bacillus sp. SD088]|nr:iron chelate uptake ABC transporter family permease subunit [Bacillus sp. SD088]